MAFIQYLVFDGMPLPLPDSYEVSMEDVEADSGGEAEMFIEGYKAGLVKDTSYKGLWKVSFTMREF